jgi:hypothetical protein
MNEWIDTRIELPPCDGTYEINNSQIEGQSPSGIAIYDGIGFLYEYHYVNPRFWRNYSPLTKKYGKIITNE